MILLGLTYAGLLVAASIFIPAGPRRALEISVAKDGTFTISSWLKRYVTGTAVDLWSADLTHIRRIRGPDSISGWAHSLSLDGASVAVVTSDGRKNHLDLLSVQTDRLKKRSLMSTRRLPMSLQLFGGERYVLIANGQVAEVHDLKSRSISRFDAYEAHPHPDPSRTFFLISSLVTTGPRKFDRLRHYYEATTEGLLLIHSMRRSGDALEGLGTAIDSHGTIAIQERDRVRLITRSGEGRDVEVGASNGSVFQFSPSGRYLSLVNRSRISVLDTVTSKMVATYEPQVHWSWRDCTFQDDQHLLLVEDAIDGTGRYSKNRNDRIVRWNWRTGQKQSQEVGWTTSRNANWMRVALFAASLLWLMLCLFQARRVRSWRCALAVVAASIFFIGLCASWHPLAEDMYLDSEALSLPWIVLVVAWLAAAACVSTWAALADGPLFCRLPILLIAYGATAWKLYWLHAEGSWVAVLVVLTTSGWLLLLLALLRRSGYFAFARIDGACYRTTAGSKHPVNLKSLLWVMTALTFVFAIVSRFARLEATRWDLGVLVAYGAMLVAFVGAVAWAALSTAAWWKRYSLLGAIVGFAIGVTLMTARLLEAPGYDIVWGFDAALAAVFWLSLFTAWGCLLVFRMSGYRLHRFRHLHSAKPH